jgi:transcriptional regulator of acetoin/glycerol metabolism
VSGSPPTPPDLRGAEWLNVRGLDAVLWEAMGRSVGSWIRPSKEQLEALRPGRRERAPLLLSDGRMRELTPVEVQELRDRYDGTRGSAAKIAALWGVSRFQVYRALKRHGIEESLPEEDDESSGKPKGRSAGGRSR